jgi:hypothetical protein
MLIPFENQVDEKEFRKLLLQHFPELEEEIEDDAGLVHLEMGALERLANTCIKGGNLEGLKRTYEFIGDLDRHQKEVHPDVINAIHVSFLEGLNFENKKHGEKAKSLLPAILLEMWNAQMEHNRKIGWFK